jgi:hypothetical protein
LSLTSKDLIATFNWDPLLMQAYERASKITRNLPQLAFLHGNVAIGYCENDGVLGWNGHYCRCGEKLTPVDLLYPVKDKNYTSNSFIAKEWKRLGIAMKSAYMVTIFGYSAPKSDVSAIQILKQAWGKIKDRNMEEIEIIDIRGHDEVVDSWKDFIHTHHYEYVNSFFDSMLGKCPRRTCEVTFDRLMNVQWYHKGRGFKENMNFQDISVFIQNMLEEESLNPKMLSNPYL